MHRVPRRRRGIAAGLVAVVGLASGCFVADELDKSEALLEGQPPHVSAGVPGPAERGGSDDPLRARVARWWSGLRSLAPDDGRPDVVRCVIDDALRFTSADDCAVRGGRALD